MTAAKLFRGAVTGIGNGQNLLIGSVTFSAQGWAFDSTASGTKEDAFAALKGEAEFDADL